MRSELEKDIYRPTLVHLNTYQGVIKNMADIIRHFSGYINSGSNAPRTGLRL